MKLFDATVLLTALYSILNLTSGFSQQKTGFEKLQGFAQKESKFRLDSNIRNTLGVFDSTGNINYLSPILILLSNKEKIITQYGNKWYYEQLGTYLSFIGDYKNALISFDKTYPHFASNPISKETIDEIRACKIIPFTEFLKDVADKNTVIMINEAHHKPLHRVNVTGMLDILYKSGYRTLAVEALANFTGQSFKDFVPGQSTGFYTAEPCMSELLRQANKLGFRLLPYEVTYSQFKFNNRDSMQALNILDSVVIGPNNKLLIYAGYGHIDDGDSSNLFPTMAKYFKAKSGIDPLTIDQNRFIEEEIKTIEAQDYNQFLLTHNINEVSVPYSEGKPFLAMPFTDVALVFPKTIYKNVRPNSLFNSTLKKEYQVKIPVKFKENAFIAQAFYSEEIKCRPVSKLIPADQTYDRDRPYFSLYLNSGRYRIIIRDIENEVIYSKDVIVK
jgi:hypothetical protein